MAQLFPVAKKLWVGPYLVLQDSNLSHGLVSPTVLHRHFLYPRFFYFTKYCLTFLTKQQGKSYQIFLIITIILMFFKCDFLLPLFLSVFFCSLSLVNFFLRSCDSLCIGRMFVVPAY